MKDRVAVISANLGSYDAEVPWVPQVVGPGITVDVYRFTDANFPPRPLAMTSALRAGIPKWFGADFAQDADVIIWIDASCVPTPIAVKWFMEKLGDADIAVFAHPDRKTVREEYEFMVRKLAEGNRYLTSRYRGEWLHEQFRHLEKVGYADAPLFASTAFVYVPNQDTTDMLREVFLWKARYHLHDQLAFASVLAGWIDQDPDNVHTINVIPDSYLKCPALVYMRNKRKRENVAR